MQLIRPGVEMLDPIKQKPIGPAEVMEKFGVTPDKMIDVQALIGDTTDNVPGVPGIGPKGAAQLINEFGDLESVLTAAPAMKPSKRRDNLIEHAAKARVSRELVTLRLDTPMPVPVDRLRARAYDKATLGAWLKLQGFRSIATRLGLDGEAAPHLPSRPSRRALASGRQHCRCPRQRGRRSRTSHRGSVRTRRSPRKPRCALSWRRPRPAGFLAIDTKTEGPGPMRAQLMGLSVAVAPGRAAYVPLLHEGLTEQVPLAAAVAALGPVLSDPAVLKIYHDAKFDMLAMQRAGFPPAAPFDDTTVISYAQEAGMHGHGLDELAQLHLGHTPLSYDEVTGTGRNRIPFSQVPIERATAYAAEDADVALRLWQALRPRLRFNGALALYEQLERRLLPVLLEMERAGIKVDADDLRRMSVDFEQRMAVIERDIHRLAGRVFNVGSAKQLGEVLFDEMKLGGGRRMKTGAWGTDASVLQTLADQGSELPARILDWRQLQKLKSTYADALIGEINPDTGRVHTSFAQCDRVHRPAIIQRSQPAEHPDPHRGRQPNPPRLHCRTGAPARVGRLFADRAAAAGTCCGHPGAARELRARRGHPRAHRFRGVRRPDGGDGPDDAAAGQGDQFRDHLRHQRLRPGAPARHHTRRGAHLHRCIFHALPRHPGVHGAHEGGGSHQRLRVDAVRSPLLGARYRRQEPCPPRLCRTPGDQCAAAGWRCGHHQACDGAPAEGAGGSRAALAPAAAGARRTAVRGTRGRGPFPLRIGATIDGERDCAVGPLGGGDRRGTHLGRRALTDGWPAWT